MSSKPHTSMQKKLKNKKQKNKKQTTNNKQQILEIRTIKSAITIQIYTVGGKLKLSCSAAVKKCKWVNNPHFKQTKRGYGGVCLMEELKTVPPPLLFASEMLYSYRKSRYFVPGAHFDQCPS